MPARLPTPSLQAQADIWSYGVLIWEIASGQDVTRYTPLALTSMPPPEGVRRGAAAAGAGQARAATRRAGGADLHGVRETSSRKQACNANWLNRLVHAQPLPQAEGESGGQAGRPAIAMPRSAPQLARHIFASCTQQEPSLRPNAAQLVEWLRGGKVCDCCAV